MHVLEIRLKCSDPLLAIIEAMRGGMTRDDFLTQALSIGVGHLQEEVLNQQRQRAYERLAINTENYRAALELQQVVAVAGGPATPTVASFGHDVTRPKAMVS